MIVLPAHGREALARASLARAYGALLNVRSSEAEVRLLEGATGSANQVALLFTVLSVLVGILFAYNAMLLTLPARRRYVTRLRNMGIRPHELAGLLALEVLMLGLAGSLAGLLLGDLLSRALFGAVPRYLAAGFPIGTQRVISAGALGIAIGGGMLATAVASIAPAIGALRGGAFEGAREAEESAHSLQLLSGSRSLALGACACALALALALAVPGGGLIAVGALAIGLGLLLGPAVTALVGRAFHWTRRLPDPSAYIATIELRAAPTRAIAVAATSAIAVYAIVAIGGAARSIVRGAEAATLSIVGGAQVGILATRLEYEPFPVQQIALAPVQSSLRALGEIARVEVLRGSFLEADGRRLLVIGMPPSDPTAVSSSQVIEGSATRASRLIRSGRWAAISATLASQLHLRIGEAFDLPTPTGVRSLRVAALVTNYGWLPGAIVLSGAQYARLWRSEGAGALRVHLRPGVSPEQGRAAIAGALAGTGLYVGTAHEDEASISAATDQGLSQLGQIATLVLVVAVLAIVATTAGSIWQRRLRLDGLRRHGVRRGVLVRSMFLETGGTAVIGCAIGIVFGLGGQAIAVAFVKESTGFPEIYAPALALGLGTLALVSGLAAIATGMIGLLVTSRRLGGSRLP